MKKKKNQQQQQQQQQQSQMTAGNVGGLKDEGFKNPLGVVPNGSVASGSQSLSSSDQSKVCIIL